MHVFYVGILLITFQLLHKSEAQSFGAVNASSAESYDYGCIQAYHDFVDSGDILEQLRNGSAFPSCAEGGLWKNVQCNMTNCFCTYIDTGKKQTENIPQSDSYTEMLKICPYAQEHDRDSCILPPLSYPCNVSNEKFFFNNQTQQCEAIPFGCSGFETREMCNVRCVYDKCTFPVNVGRQCDDEEQEERYYHNNSTGLCEVFSYQGCGGNTNNYKSQWNCQKSCVNQDVEVDVQLQSSYLLRIRAPIWIISRYQLLVDSVNTISDSVFADINEYITIYKITKLTTTSTTTTTTTTTTTAPTTTTSFIPREQTIRLLGNPSEICREEPSVGPCRAYMPRWYFDSESSNCKGFIFGGCSTKGNNFRDSQDCQRYCKAKNPVRQYYNEMTFRFEELD